jgi:hypoxanthine phosphoribosyltransferase
MRFTDAIQELMSELIPVLEKREIAALVSEIAGKISEDYRDRDLVLVGVLKGAFVFLADLVRHLTIPARVDFIRAASYGDAMASSGTVRLLMEPQMDLAGRDALLVEDIVDSGLTLSFLLDYVKNAGARTARVCTLIDKRERRETDVRVDYACHVASEGFLVGYGLDYAEAYRCLPGIYHLKL